MIKTRMNFNTKTILFFIFLLLTNISQAGLGAEISRSEIPHNLCLLDFTEKSSKSFNGVCSGILIDSSTLLTAAHCIKKEMPQTIRCGNDLNEVSFNSDSSQTHQGYQKNIIINQVAMEINDLATIKLNSKVKIRPIKLISFDMVENENECAFFGFSQFIGKPKNEIDDEARGWRITQQNIQYNNSYHFHQMEGLKAPGALLQVGDSGGPLMCQQNGQWNLLGINSSRDFFSRSNFMAVNDVFFIQDQLKQNENVYFSNTDLLEQKKKNLIFDIKNLEKKIKRLKGDFQYYLDQLSQILQSNTSYNAIKDSIDKIEKSVIKELLKTNNLALRLKPYTKVDIQNNNDKKSIGDLSFNFFLPEIINFESGLIIGKLKTIGPSDYFLCTGELICDSQVFENVSVSIEDFDIYQADANRVFK